MRGLRREKPFRVFVDICNSIADVNSELQKRGVDTTVYPSKVNFGTEEWLKVFAEALPFPGSAEAIQKLAEDFEVVYITSRPKIATFVTLRWLKLWGFPEGELLIGVKDKARYAKIFNPVFALEDDPKIAKAYTELRVPVIVKKQPYNCSLERNPLVVVVEDFMEVWQLGVALSAFK
ncbi:HAD family hydrolase [Carboxydothermus ferrireducens]|uniref:HAD superfamily protein n=1 Tax=Carboxydothermus ferrireducens DSM 11255 TaxID=1119529 RepID=A0ABX2RBF5_9THEO|nr:hypothetical protein [Carboxydothermus ferrireducens]NYE57205.1 putative HAD superfamily protein [Carboxydothermus ferrireducens DSM 11255]